MGISPWLIIVFLIAFFLFVGYVVIRKYLAHKEEEKIKEELQKEAWRNDLSFYKKNEENLEENPEEKEKQYDLTIVSKKIEMVDLSTMESIKTLEKEEEKGLKKGETKSTRRIEERKQATRVSRSSPSKIKPVRANQYQRKASSNSSQ